MEILLKYFLRLSSNPVDTGRNLNEHKTFRRRSGRLAVGKASGKSKHQYPVSELARPLYLCTGIFRRGCMLKFGP